MTKNNFKELKTRSLAVNYLAEHLIDGTIVLFLGAGASIGFGLPSWIELANKFMLKFGLCEIPLISSVEEIQNKIDIALDLIEHDENKKIQIIRELLYPNTASEKKAYESKLLVAISSLLIGRSRGHISKVVSYNYDSTLEWFLSLFGFSVNTIYHLPAMEGSEDVTIYHPHGFIPKPTLNLQSSNDIVFGMRDADKRLAENIDNKRWRQKTKDIMESSVCLFVGMSGNSLTDRSISPIITEVGDLVKKNRPLGIWIYKDILEKSKDDEFLRKNIIALEIQDSNDICDFILEISQKALELSR